MVAAAGTVEGVGEGNGTVIATGGKGQLCEVCVKPLLTFFNQKSSFYVSSGN